MKKFLISFVTIVTIFLSGSQSAFAASTCEIGPVLFRDTLYGAAVGAGVGALVLLANSSSNNIVPTLATSALVGGGTGVIIGVVELSFADCFSHKKSGGEEYGYRFKLKPIITLVDKLNVPIFQSQFDKNQIGGGLSLVYQLN